jgi:hypothetical protein
VRRRRRSGNTAARAISASNASSGTSVALKLSYWTVSLLPVAAVAVR